MLLDYYKIITERYCYTLCDSVWGALMKRLSFGVLAVCLLAGTTSAFAADLPIPMKAPPVPFDPWTGWYVGANVGGSFGRASDSTTVGGVPFSSTTTNLDGVIGGAQFGYNYRVNPSWLLGFETDFQGSSEQGTANTFLGVAIPGIRVSSSTQHSQ